MFDALGMIGDVSDKGKALVELCKMFASGETKPSEEVVEEASDEGK